MQTSQRITGSVHTTVAPPAKDRNAGERDRDRGGGYRGGGGGVQTSLAGGGFGWEPNAIVERDDRSAGFKPEPVQSTKGHAPKQNTMGSTSSSRMTDSQREKLAEIQQRRLAAQKVRNYNVSDDKEWKKQEEDLRGGDAAPKKK